MTVENKTSLESEYGIITVGKVLEVEGNKQSIVVALNDTFIDRFTGETCYDYDYVIEDIKNPITWYVSGDGTVFIWNGTHNIDSMTTEQLELFCNETINRITEDNEINEFFASLGYLPYGGVTDVAHQSEEIWYFLCDEWGNDLI